jgi:AcrR family transcriptional regulator
MSEQIEGRDTRSRIQAVALELFTEEGYDKTSLREIAERLGVTKAALYYHFKSKQEIIDSLTADQMARVEKLIAWGLEQPRTLEMRREFLRRYAETMVHNQHSKVMRFFERNQAAMKNSQAGRNSKERMAAVIDLLVEPDDPPVKRLRAAMAFFSLHACWFVLGTESFGDEERMNAALDMAYELIEADGGSRRA